MSAELNIEHLRKVFATGVAAVDDVSFRIERGEIVVLLGPSGCGKTTTLRCVAGLEHPTSGVIGIGGNIVSAPEQGLLLPPRLRNIGMVFQSYAVWPHMTVRQNVAYPLRHRRTPRVERDGKIHDVLELVGLRAYADRVVQLSGGQMQRVAARSLVYEPPLLLLDEPLSTSPSCACACATICAHHQAHRRNRPLCDARPGRGGGAGRPDRRHARGSCCRWRPPPRSAIAQPTCSSPVSQCLNLLNGRVMQREQEFGVIEAASGRLTAWLPASVKAGEPVEIAVRRGSAARRQWCGRNNLPRASRTRAIRATQTV
jgi:iron(III) transport system ATP-binding protein